MIVRKKESAPVDPPRKPLAGPRVDQPAPSNPLPTPQPFIRPDFFTREQVDSARDAQARKFATPATGKIEGEGLIDVVVPVVAAPIAKAIIKPLAAAFSKPAVKLADDAFAPIAKKMDPNLPLPKSKAVSPDMPLTTTSEQSKKVIHVLSGDEVIENANKRVDFFEGKDVLSKNDVPEFLEIDGRRFPLNPDLKDKAQAQAAFVLEYNSKLNSLNRVDDVIPIERVAQNSTLGVKDAEAVRENVQQLSDLGITSQVSNDADRLLFNFYQNQFGASAVNTKQSAYVGLSDYLKEKFESAIFKQPKTTKESTFFAGKKFMDSVSIVDDNGNVVSNSVIGKLKPGDKFRLDALLSNSLNESVANSFNDLTLEIASPKGLSMLNVNTAKNLGKKDFVNFAYELENVLYKDATFRVDDVIENGRSRYKVTLMNPKVLIPAFVTLKLNQNSDESEE